MCVTSSRAIMTNTMVYGYVPLPSDSIQRHVVGYQNQAESLAGDNFMLLNFAGTDLQLVCGPEHTVRMMSNMTAGLQQVLEFQGGFRGGDGLRGGSYSVRIEEYGDYVIFFSQSASAIVEAVMDHPDSSSYDTASIRDLAHSAEYFEQHYPLDSFLVPMFKHGAKVKPTHPIVVSYVPRQPEFLTVPGLDGHDGTMPVVGAPAVRDFKLAFGVQGVELSPVRYKDDVSPLWAPESVIGFVDNREDGLNGNYSLPIEVIRNYVDNRDEFERKYFWPGTDLVDSLVLENL